MSPEAAKKWERETVHVPKNVIQSNRTLVSRNLKAMRAAFDVSQMDVAARIGCSLQSVQAWEQGRKMPSMEWLTKLATLFGVDVAYFYTDPGRPPKPVKKTRKKTGH